MYDYIKNYIEEEFEYLHQHPELSFEEYETTKRKPLKSRLPFPTSQCIKVLCMPADMTAMRQLCWGRRSF